MRKESWKASRVRILTSGPKGREDGFLVEQLKEDGLANAAIRKDYSGMNKPPEFMWYGPTTAGLEQRDRWAAELEQSTWRHRIKMWASYAAAALFGAFAEDLVDLIRGLF